MQVLDKLFTAEIIWVTIPLAVIILAYARRMLNRYFEHQERMAKIEAGLDPDSELD